MAKCSELAPATTNPARCPFVFDAWRSSRLKGAADCTNVTKVSCNSSRCGPRHIAGETANDTLRLESWSPTPRSWSATYGSTAPAPGARESYRETDSDNAAYRGLSNGAQEVEIGMAEVVSGSATFTTSISVTDLRALKQWLRGP